MKPLGAPALRLVRKFPLRIAGKSGSNHFRAPDILETGDPSRCLETFLFRGQYGFDRTALIDGGAFLEVETDFCCDRTWCDIVRPAKG
jgi:hypothetical protein